MAKAADIVTIIAWVLMFACGHECGNDQQCKVGAYDRYVSSSLLQTSSAVQSETNSRALLSDQVLSSIGAGHCTVFNQYPRKVLHWRAGVGGGSGGGTMQERTGPYDSEDRCQQDCGDNEWCIGYSWRSGNPSHPHYHKCFLLATLPTIMATSQDFVSGICKTSPPTDETYVEGRVSNAEYDPQIYSTDSQAQAACSSADACKGYYQSASNKYNLLNRPGSRTWEKGLPTSSVSSVKVKTSAGTLPTPQPTPPFDENYVEGRVSNADNNGRVFSTYWQAQAACSSDDGCKGYWLRVGDEKYLLLRRGSRTWEKGVPNGSVMSVKVKTSAGL